MGDNELSQDDIDTLFDKTGAASGEGAGGEDKAALAEQTAPAEQAAPAAVAESSDAVHVRQKAGLSEVSVSVATSPNEKEQVDTQPVEFSQLTGQAGAGEVRKIDFLLDVPVTITVELGRTAMVIRDAINLGSGSVVELNKLAGEPVDLLINNKLVARAEVVVVNENFGVKVIDIVSPEERLRYLR